MTSRQRVAKRFCTTREAADILGVSVKTAQMWTESGLLEGWRTEGGHRRIVRASVEKLLAEDKSGLPTVPAEGVVSSAGVPLPLAMKPAERRFRVLVAEDEINLRTLYSLQLSRWVLAPVVVLVANGFQALLEIGRQPPDLLIADLQMPDIDGFKMLRTLNECEDLRGMAIVVVTGLNAETVRDRGGLPPGVRLLPKPIPFSELEKIANEIAAQREAQMLAA